MKYRIVYHPESGHAQYLQETTSERKARQMAAAEARKGGRITIEWFRASDGQHGYLNRDGHSMIGRAW